MGRESDYEDESKENSDDGRRDIPVLGILQAIVSWCWHCSISIEMGIRILFRLIDFVLPLAYVTFISQGNVDILHPSH